MVINLDPTSLYSSLQGKKAYLTLAVGAAVIAANHFGLMPAGYVTLNPDDWMSDEYKLIAAAAFRSAIAKVQNPQPDAKPAPHETK